MSGEPAVVIFSGGPDSTAAAIWAIEQGFEVELLTYQFSNEASYGEIRASMEIARGLKKKHTIIDFKSPMHVFTRGIRPMMHSGIREKAAADDAGPYLLPFGSGLVLSFASAYAIDQGVKHVIWGATRDDAYDNPSYQAGFANELARLISKTTRHLVTIHTPLKNRYKHQIIESLYALGDLFPTTWTCIESGPVQCGKCVACIARRVSAELAGVQDATPYISKTYNSPLTKAQISSFKTLSKTARAELLGPPGRKKAC